ncbi:hypothetical protein P5705_15735 [Pseudomonas entomophila]|uniref:Imm43 family immunity protein n=1 Tax=Pseudomonas entomophila TaxID=312306 RepID=UPI0024060642|nr:hypothetical protein [Pseudomonas entomophila]MDF9619098.1 hypothetical protein [Pseudomonas entomophila]
MLSQKKDIGCPVGKLNAALYDRFYDNAKSMDHGIFPWYANAALGRPHEKLPEGLVLIASVKKIEFSVRMLYDRLYAASEEFLEVCRELGVQMLDCVKIDVVSSLNKSIVSSQYYVVVFDVADYDALVMSSSEVSEGMRGWINDFDQLDIRDSAPDLFRLNRLHPRIATLFCSDEFKRKLDGKGLKGIELLPLSKFSSQDLEAI